MIRDSLFLTAYCLLIFMLSAQSTLPTPLKFPHQDKLIHATAYAIMAWLAWHAFSHHIKSHLSLAAISIVFVSMYGITDEFHQSFVAGRNADILDWLADTIGGVCMVLTIYYWQLRRSFKAQ
ncbi:MAG: VanZ family protein [Mariprofundaceae bacterium]|nr:VanZ family protein [Mariprofundaceae bacterium]